MVHRVAFLNYEKTAIGHFYTFAIIYNYLPSKAAR